MKTEKVKEMNKKKKTECITTRSSDNKSYYLSDKAAIIVGVIYMSIIAFVVGRDLLLRYHAKMHCALTWGVVTSVHYPSAKTWHSCIEYENEGTHYKLLTQQISPVFLGDSVLVYYDTLRVSKAFLPKRNPKDAQTAFFKSHKKYFGMKWQKDLEKYQRKLADKQEAHKRKEHFYDYFCKDD